MEFFLDISSSLFKHIGHVISPGKNVGSLITEMDELKSKREDVMRAVDAAERRPQMRRKNEVNHWLVRVEMLEGEVDKMDEELRSRPDIAWFKVWARYQLSKIAAERLEEARDLNTKGNFAEVADVRPVCIEEMPCPELTVGLGALLEQLHSLVQETAVGVIGVCGMGGVGKTTLLSRFNNELRTVDHGFDMVISIKVSENPNMEKIQKAICSRSGLPWQEDDGCEERALHIRQALSKVRFVIMLDDLWDPLCLSSVGIPIPNSRNGCKIILATRKVDVCTAMDTHRIVKVGCLQWRDAWQLFLEKAGKGFVYQRPVIRRHAEVIARKCGGLPLALTAVGRTMATKRTPAEWMHVIRSLKSSPAEVDGMEGVLHCLKRSYDDLRGDGYRSSFLYCSLFPEGATYKGIVIKYWIGEGILEGFDDIDEAYEKGIDIFGRLERASLLETGDGDAEEVKMHDMIRSMALWVASDCGKVKNQWLVQVGAELSEAPDLSKWAGAERVSLADNRISSICTGDKHCPRLISLMLNNNTPLRSLSSKFFRSMQSLRVLALSGTSIEELPPEVSMLTELQCLDLQNTKLRSLPRELGNLPKLRCLELCGTSTLEYIPGGVIRGLSASLQVLGMALTYAAWKVGEAGDGISFEELEGLKRLKRLDITVATDDALRRLSSSPRLSQSTHGLVLLVLPERTAIHLPADLGLDMKKLRWLCISLSTDVEQVIIDNSEWASLLNLEFLQLGCLSMAKIIWKGVLPPGSPEGLVTLDVRKCPKVEQLIGEVAEEGEGEDGVEASTVFPTLRNLFLSDLPELQCICGSALVFPSLRVLKVDRCPKLKKLPFGPSSGKKLEAIQGQMQWWEGLEWEDDAIRSAFLPLFRQQEASS